MKALYTICLAIALTALLAACGGGGKVNPAMNPEKISISQTHGTAVQNAFGEITVSVVEREDGVWISPIRFRAASDTYTGFRVMVNFYDLAGNYLSATSVSLKYDPNDQDDREMWPQREFAYYGYSGPERFTAGITEYYIGPGDPYS